MKVLFLDFDGVLNGDAYLTAVQSQMDERAAAGGEFWHLMLDPDAVERVNRIIDATGAAVVVSSSWRKGRSRHDLLGLLVSAGFRHSILDKTPALGVRRGLEIQDWMTAHAVHAQDIVILDDDADMEHLLPRLVQTSFDTGLTDEHADRAIRMLAGLTATPALSHDPAISSAESQKET